MNSIISTLLQFFSITGSLALFLFGLKMMSESLQSVAGKGMRGVLESLTAKSTKGVFAGLSVTALIQSSSATTVLLLSLVNAGLLSLTESLSVVMGANIGTTITAWIISLLGFGKTFDIGILLLPIMALAFPMLLIRKSKTRSIAEILIGFALIFIGLSYLKTSIPDIQQDDPIIEYLQNFNSLSFGNILWFIIFGAIITIIFQSSSATIALTFVLVTEGWVSYELCFAMVVGENIGTTATANIAAIIANRSAKRMALFHTLFNVFGIVWVLPFYWAMLPVISELTALISQSDPLTNTAVIPISISIFHTGFNAINTLLLIGLIPRISILLQRIIKLLDKEKYQLAHIHSNFMSISELSIYQVREKLVKITFQITEMLDFIPNLLVEKENETYTNLLEKLEITHHQISTSAIEVSEYLTGLSENKLSRHTSRQLRDFMVINTNLEGMAERIEKMSRIISTKNKKKVWFTQELRDGLNEMHQLVIAALEHMVDNLKTLGSNRSLLDAEKIENAINKYRDKLRKRQIKNMQAEKYSYQAGIYYNELISLYEKIGDVAFLISEITLSETDI